MFNTLNGENDKSLTKITMKPLIFVGAPMIAIGEATDINELIAEFKSSLSVAAIFDEL